MMSRGSESSMASEPNGAQKSQNTCFYSYFQQDTARTQHDGCYDNKLEHMTISKTIKITGRLTTIEPLLNMDADASQQQVGGGVTM